MPKLLVETWVDVYSMLTDVFSMPSDLVLSDICLDDILQMAYNKIAYEGWKNYAINQSQKN
ncbi:TPA: hypothetical protein ACHSWX_000152 [Enterococcus faecium]